MKKTKFKFTEQVQKDLLKLAGELPAMYKKDRKGQPVYKMQVVDGSTIDTLDKQGNKAIPGVSYKANVLQYEKHYENLLDAFRLQGMNGAFDYADGIRKSHKQMMDAVEVLRKKKTFLGKIKSGIKSIFRLY